MTVSKEINFILCCLCLVLFCQGEFMYEPSFISDWYDVQAGQQSSSSLDIPHNLGQYPVKMDVQVKITEGEKEYIFSGIGSSQRDDDLPDYYGAVIYRYNDSHVQIGLPFRNNDYDDNFGLAYTGAGTLYNGPSSPVGPCVNGKVRVRAWLATDMPELAFNKSTQISSSTEENYRELQHGLGFYPDIVTVQTKTVNGYMSDGIGVVFFDRIVQRSFSSGGVLFGYDHQKVRLWTPYHKDGKVFLGSDGYSLGDSFSGTAIVLGWRIVTSQHVFCSKQSVGGTNSHDSVVSIPGSFDWRNYLVSVQYKIPSGHGPNGGMVFNAAGTTQASTKADYGGIVYAYTNDSIVLWNPKVRPVVYIGGMWGNNLQNQTSDVAEVIITVFHLREQECPWPEKPVNASLTISGRNYTDTANYTCNTDNVLMGGDLLRWCGRTRQWSGSPPTCIDKRHVTKSFCNSTNSLTDAELQEMVESMKVDTKTTSAYIRTKTCAADDRSSARTIGLAGVFILTSVFAIIVIPDILSIFRYVVCLIKKKR